MMLTLTLSKYAEGKDGKIRDLLLSLINLPSFERISRVSFLGAIERFAPRLEARSAESRAEHSIGVAELAAAISQSEGFSEGETRLSLVHALLHDIGHGPFSHSCEAFFQSKFGIDHHQYLRKIIENSASQESQVLRKFGLWRDYRNFLDKPSKYPVVDDLFHGPVNVDTIDGIIRASKFFGVEVSISRKSIAKALSSRPLNFKQLDVFWRLKASIYNDHIFSEEQSRYDSLICNALFSVEDEVSLGDFRLDDEAFEERFHRALSYQLNIANANRYAQKTKSRSFRLNELGKPRRAEGLKERYWEIKSKDLASSQY